MVNYLSGNIIEGSSTATSAPPATSWKELARGTLSSADSIINSGTFTAKDNIMILQHNINSGAVRTGLRLNADTGNNYAHRRQVNGGSDQTNVNHNRIVADTDVDGSDFTVSNFTNVSAQEKLGILQRIHQSGSGASNVPDREEMVGKWANTSSQITSVQSYNAESGDFDTGSEIVVLGCDNDEADSGTNFWQELVNSDSSVNDHTATFTPKKYLWVEFYVENSGSIQPELILGSGGSIDTGNNYCSRGSINGASDWTRAGHDSIETEDASGNPIYCQFFIVNKSDKEKLAIGHYNYRYTAGASTASGTIEVVGKWTNTSAQANILGFKDAGSGSFAASKLKIWGAD